MALNIFQDWSETNELPHFLVLAENVPKGRKEQHQQFYRDFHRPQESIFLLSSPLFDRILLRYQEKDPSRWKNWKSSNYQVLSTKELLPILEKEEPRFAKEFSLATPQNWILLIEAPLPNLFRKKPFWSLLYQYWKILFQGLLTCHGKTLLKKGFLSQSQTRLFFQQWQQKEVKEIQQILKSEGRVWKNENELLLEFASYFLPIYFFSPNHLKTFFPSFSSFRLLAQSFEKLGYPLSDL
ncbi:MAG: hypothetical protein AABZ60_14755, partial [Planctomycetota bacterium]